MSTENRTGFGSNQHPDENQLLLALERELPPAEATEVEHHLGTCWECRARYHEMDRGILSFIEYRDKLYLPELASAPQDFRQFPSIMNRAATEGRNPGLFDRIKDRFFRFAQSLSQTRWVTATATIVTAVLLWTQVFSPATLSASELLTKAVQSQNPPAKRGEVRQKVRIKTAKGEVVREFQWQTGSPIPDAKWAADAESWNAPLTAEGFAQWHDSLSGPQDSVEKSGDRWTMKTLAAAGPIKEASIVIRDGDFHPTEQHLRFANDGTLDIEEISFAMAEPAPAPTAVTTQAVRPADSLVTRPSPEAPADEVVPSVNLDEAELEFRYAVFTHRWDDEDLQISRSADAVIVGGIASSAERARAIQAAIAGLPGVRFSMSTPDAGPAGPAPNAGSQQAGSQKAGGSSPVPLLKDRLNEAFASTEARRDFVDDCLAASDSTLSHAWALKKLVERYTDSDRYTLRPESQAKLDEMLRGHLGELAASNALLNPLADMLPATGAPRAEAPAAWAAGVSALLDLVQQQDSLVAALVAGTQGGESATAASARFRSLHEAITRLARELKSGGGAIVAR